MIASRSRAVLLVTLLCMLAGNAFSVEPSPVKATGIVSAEFGVNASNWDVAPFNAFTFTRTDKIFPTLLISPGDQPSVPLKYAEKQL